MDRPSWVPTGGCLDVYERAQVPSLKPLATLVASHDSPGKVTGEEGDSANGGREVVKIGSEVFNASQVTLGLAEQVSSEPPGLESDGPS
ncbi:hypothetical protein N7539_007026 [Penicillium diatomitis]|uniref:Uncharacterized protein n=1 Tax=Penicillium diatomitis TaxID=2819901 RepID=A0A9X0BSV1_9EURO|nr:uncharacterized protein N7539_007026 [Penicillium diatomitis]KAJ5481132.1 hypothetical protein N7539_007026 [Penicillium diatomitis]